MAVGVNRERGDLQTLKILRAWRFADVKDLTSCDVYEQPLSLS